MSCDPQNTKWWPFFETHFERDIVDALDTNSKAGAATITGVLVDSLNYFLKGSFPIEGLAENLYDGFSGALVVGISTALQDGDSIAAFAAGAAAAIDYLAAKLTKTFAEQIINSVVTNSMTLLEVEGVEAAAILAAPEILATLAGIAVGVLGGVVTQAAVEATEDWNKANADTTCPPKPQIPNPPSKSDPLVLDLTGAGINLTALSGSKAYFDFTGSGVPVQTGWVAAGEGLLVIAPADGSTVTAANMLGAYSGNGFADLAALDSNGDGVINANDAAYSELRVWVDSAGTGQSTSGELFTLAQLGITSVDVSSTVSGEQENGNTIVSTSTFSITDLITGATTTNTIAEVNLQTNLQITELPTHDVPPSHDALDLPNLKGFGFLPDLNIAVTVDSSLKAMVQNLVLNSATMTSAQFNAAFQNMLYEWAGASEIGQTAYGDHIDGQHLAVIYAYMGINPATNPTYAGWEPNWHNGPNVWEPTYQAITQYYEAAFISQISQSLTSLGFDPGVANSNPYSAFALLAYDPEMNTFDGAEAGTLGSIPWLLCNNAPSDLNLSFAYWSQVQGAIELLGYTQVDSGMDGAILERLGAVATQSQALNAIEAMNTVAPIFAVTPGSSYTNITGDGASVTYAGTGAVEIPSQYASNGYVIVPVGCTQLTLDGAGATIVLQGATNSTDVTFSVSGSDLIATFRDGSTLDLVGQAADVVDQATGTNLMFNGGAVIPQIQIANDITAAEAASGSQIIQGFAVGGTLQGAAGNDVLIASPDAVAAPTAGDASSAGIGTTIFDVGTGNDVLVTTYSHYLNASGIKDVIDYNVGGGSELVYTVVNGDYDPRATYFSALADYANELIGSVPGIGYSSPLNPAAAQISSNSISFSAGITTADITISAAGSQVSAIDNIFAADPNTASYINDFYLSGGELNPWSLVVTIDGSKTITFTGGADTLQEIDFADGTVMTAQQIGAAYVASEEAQNLALVQGTELGNTLQGTTGSQILLGFSGNDTLLAGSDNDTLIAGAGVNIYKVNAGSGDAVIINNRLGDEGYYPSTTFSETTENGVTTETETYNPPAYPSLSVGSGKSEADDTLVLGAGIDPSQVTVTAVASIDGSDPGLPDILLTITSTGQTIRLTDQNQIAASFNPLNDGNNGAAVGQIQFADGTVWTAADLVIKANSAAFAAEAAQYAGYNLVTDSSGTNILQSGATPDLLAGGLGSTTYVVNSGDAPVVLDSGLNGADGGTVDVYDYNVLKFGAGIGESDVTVTQSANGSDIILTIGSTGQTITLASQLTADSGAVISTVEFADGTTWNSEQLFLASEAGSLAAGATTIYGSANLSDAVGFSDSDSSATLIGRWAYRPTYDLGSGNQTAIVSTADADIDVPVSFGNDTIDLTGAAAGGFFGYLTVGTIPTSAEWSADGQDLILSFGDSSQTLTLKNFTGGSGLTIENPALYTTIFNTKYYGSEDLFSLFPALRTVTAAAGQANITVDHDDMTIDPAGNARTVNVTGNFETFDYGAGDGAVTIDETETSTFPENALVLGSSLSIDDRPGLGNYSVDAAGDLTLNFGDGDVLTIAHEYNPMARCQPTASRLLGLFSAPALPIWGLSPARSPPPPDRAV